MKKIGIIGAGFSGAVIARELATNGYKIDIFESRTHVAGNCHTEIDSETNIMVHKYGPHIFHTSNKKIWDYINQFGQIMPFTNRVKAIYKGQVYSLPVNLLTINSLFKKSMSPKEAIEFISKKSIKFDYEPITFEEQALKLVGAEIYEAFLKGYTIKQWGIHPSKLPASILKRLPVRFNYDDNYYTSTYQGIPKHGYTDIINRILNHENINLALSSKFTRGDKAKYDHVFYSGPIDAWFNHSMGRLAYRTLDFAKEVHNGDYQGNAVVNYCDESTPWTRISEHKYFSPWEKNEKTIIYKEYSKNCEGNDIPYYPVRLVEDKAVLKKYLELAQTEIGVTFVGRLGTYRYLDMHITIEEALEVAHLYLKNEMIGAQMSPFVIDPTS